MLAEHSAYEPTTTVTPVRKRYGPSLDLAKSTKSTQCDGAPVLHGTDTGAGEEISAEDPKEEFDICPAEL
jgi:hypothetical protein